MSPDGLIKKYCETLLRKYFTTKFLYWKKAVISALSFIDITPGSTLIFDIQTGSSLMYQKLMCTEFHLIFY